jgi:hypothetical protein
VAPHRLTIALPFPTDLPAITALAATDAPAADSFRSDLRLAMALCCAGVGAQRTTAHDNTWDIWLTYCAAHSVNTLLASVPDPIPYLQVFAQHFRDGRLAKNGDPL